MEIKALKYGESSLPESMIFINGDKEKRRQIVFKVYVIRQNEKLVLVDAGCETMPGFVMENFIGTKNALKNIGIECSDVTDVIITHSHHDHIECVGYFKDAIIHIQEDEYENGKKYLLENTRVNTFKEETLVCDGIKIIKIGGHSKGSSVVEVNCNGDTYIIASDECYSRDNLTEKIPTGCSVCPEKSKLFVEKYSDKKYKVLLAHDS